LLRSPVFGVCDTPATPTWCAAGCRDLRPFASGGVARLPRGGVAGTGPAMTTNTTPAPAGADAHDPWACPGCDRILGIDDLVVFLGEPRDTLYKRSARGWPAFPRRLRDRRAVAVLCRHAKAYLEAVTE
jgi:hypothetical protein